jgi:hypothetical protein
MAIPGLQALAIHSIYWNLYIDSENKTHFKINVKEKF